MKTEPTYITLEEYHRQTAPRSRKRATRADIPRAPADARVGLGPLLRRGWSLAGNDDHQRLYKINEPAVDTGPCADLATACRRARELER